MNRTSADDVHHMITFLSFILIFCSFYGVIDGRDYACPSQLLSVSEEPLPALGKLQVTRHATPYGNATAGLYVSRGRISLIECVKLCCLQYVNDKIGLHHHSFTCHTVFHYDGRCLLVECFSERLCQPLVRSGDKFRDYYVVNVRSPIIQITDSDDDDDIQENYNFVPPSELRIADDEPGDIFGQLVNFPFPQIDRPQERRSMSASLVNSPSKVCDLIAPPNTPEIGDNGCPQNEICVPRNHRSRQGVCVCLPDRFIRDQLTGRCVSLNDRTSISISSSLKLEDSSVNPISVPTAIHNESPVTLTALRHLVVSAGDSKVMRLPQNSGTLSAFAVASSDAGEQPYKYEWSLLTHPSDDGDGDGIGVVMDKNAPTVKFSGLKEGIYKFKVTVSNEFTFGEAYVNVTVLPPERMNKPPVAVINPVNQTVKLPNTDVVLDGSASADDDGISSYAWEVVTAPIDYSIATLLTNTATLQLKNLVPGFYTFMLTVTDTDGVKNSTYSNITVNKETDYPPTANAGPDVIVYLPRNEVTLNGSLSSDDKGIKIWEWTKGVSKTAGDASVTTEKAVDMKDTRKPLLHLSNLDLGMYTFVLRVTDTADQSSSAEVHVFVKPAKEGPFANAGVEQTIALPTNSVVLDGSKSNDNVKISRWEWKQVSGPSQSVLANADQPKATASKLTKGVYVFQLSVYDDNRATSTNTTTVTVLQSKNDPPKANAGGDLTVEMPCNLVVVNGSLSTDDVSIVKYEWKRDPTSSLAVGEIVEGTDRQPLLMLVGLLPGRYVFKLTVTDAEGSSDSDTASIIIQSSPRENDDVEMKIASDVFSFSEEQKITLSKKLALLVQDDEAETRVIVTHISMEKNTRRVFLLFHVERSDPHNGGSSVKRLNGLNVVRALRRRLRLDAGLLGVPVLSIETVVCQNKCSGHGSCDPYTKRCVCDAFWMEDFFRSKSLTGDGESNCDWSILYVIIVLIVSLVVLILFTWSLFCLCSNRNQSKRSSTNSRFRLSEGRRHRRRHRYTRLSLDERNAGLEGGGGGGGNVGVVVPLAGKQRRNVHDSCANNFNNLTTGVVASDSDLSESELTVFDKSKPIINGDVAMMQLRDVGVEKDLDDVDEMAVVKGLQTSRSSLTSHKLRT